MQSVLLDVKLVGHYDRQAPAYTVNKDIDKMNIDQENRILNSWSQCIQCRHQSHLG